MAQENVVLAIAAGTVLRSLGNPLFEILRYYLERDHSIAADADGHVLCSLEQLHSALTKLAGQHAATLILEEILVEMDRISAWDYWHQTAR